MSAINSSARIVKQTIGVQLRKDVDRFSISTGPSPLWMIAIHSGDGVPVDKARGTRCRAFRVCFPPQPRIAHVHKEMLKMLVLSRKPQETIVFPNLGITLEIVRIADGKVRVGIDAPSEVHVLRGELAERLANAIDSGASSEGAADKSTHRLRNRVHTARLGLKLLEKQLAGGLFDQAEETLAKALGIFRELDSELARASNGANIDLGRRALVVEDDENESHLLAGILRMSGYVVDTAHDGLQAIESLKKNQPTFVLLDMNMPRCDGLTTLALIRARPEWRGLRIFAVTGCSQREMGVSVSEVGVDRWFQKPVDPEVLLGAMNESAESRCVSA